MANTKYTTLFLDVGGVFLTNGWDHHMREKAAAKFNIDYKEMSARHSLTFDTFEIGKINLDTYIERIVFYENRNFSLEEFKKYMFSQSQPFPEMIEMFKKIKDQFELKIAVVSNEGRELMEYRIDHFKMKEFVDVFISSGFIKMRKPDEEFYKYAMDAAQAKPEEIIYIDDRELLVQIGRSLGMEGIHHKNHEETRHKLLSLLN